MSDTPDLAAERRLEALFAQGSHLWFIPPSTRQGVTVALTVSASLAHVTVLAPAKLHPMLSEALDALRPRKATAVMRYADLSRLSAVRTDLLIAVLPEDLPNNYVNHVATCVALAGAQAGRQWLVGDPPLAAGKLFMRTFVYDRGFKPVQLSLPSAGPSAIF